MIITAIFSARMSIKYKAVFGMAYLRSTVDSQREGSIFQFQIKEDCYNWGTD